MTTTDPRQGRAASSDERMAVRTPEPVQLNFLLAGAGNRFLALLADLAIQWLLFLGIVLVLGGLQWVTKWSVGGGPDTGQAPQEDPGHPGERPAHRVRRGGHPEPAAQRARLPAVPPARDRLRGGD